MFDKPVKLSTINEGVMKESAPRVKVVDLEDSDNQQWRNSFVKKIHSRY